MKKDMMEMTREEILARIEEVDCFQGRTANMQKAQVYNGMKKKLTTLSSVAPDVKGVTVLAPAPDHANAMMSVNFERVCSLSVEAKAILAELIQQADDVFVTVPEGESGARISFGVRDIWEA